MTSGGDGQVRVEGLEKTFWERGRGEIRAVAGIDFSCRPGEVFGLLGANGAGKTTTLRMLATLLRPDGGSARVLGHENLDVLDPTKCRADVSVRRARRGPAAQAGALALLDTQSAGPGVEPSAVAVLGPEPN